jgi:hypothetical protein
VQAAALALGLGFGCPRDGFGGELDLFVSAGGADIEWGQ